MNFLKLKGIVLKLPVCICFSIKKYFLFENKFKHIGKNINNILSMNTRNTKQENRKTEKNKYNDFYIDILN